MNRTSRTLTFAEAFDLPLSVDLRTAARAFAVCPATAYRLVHLGRFPCRVVRIGHQYRIPTASLMRALGIENLPVYAADVEAGAEMSAALTHDAEEQEDRQ
ncbi:helix-turn-helix domain-containing protein [Streptomyces mirabilis]|uniref:helix-turn-helix domain-containing protein n=1 Tax=Streptomyces mirabilis TaxID=68239 RepID=UPI0021BE68B3|nr:helix-turn-helix domain-containing protein [Streptomyces mirabilis]MCT9112972.1 helix-turn-helix domain-containing protein [Streptomyces mirabilis]